MAPPSFGPPGYPVPPRYMHREPPPDGADTNTRPYLIFFSYLTVCFLVAVFIIQRLGTKYAARYNGKATTAPPKQHVLLFGLLAAGSLLSTWTFMFRYFGHSYQTWLMWRSYYELDPHQKHWGLWLRQTSLFREAWETVIIGNARYWWSHQIFFFALGLGLYLEQKGIRRGIKYTWAFMLLGQIVAISFATNLFFLTLLLSSPLPSSTAKSMQGQKWLGLWLLNLFAIVATAYPALLLSDEHYWHHPTGFMPVLLAPHVALMVLPVVRAMFPARWFNDVDFAFTDKVYNYLWVLTIINGGLMLLKTSITAYAYSGFEGVRHALMEHPAVSSVGFDVIFCWVSWACWLWTQGKRQKIVEATPVREVDDGVVHDSSGIAVGLGGRARRR